MEPYRLTRQAGGGSCVAVPYLGTALSRPSRVQQGSAFTAEERAAFGLEGLLPWASNTVEQQAGSLRDRSSGERRRACRP